MSNSGHGLLFATLQTAGMAMCALGQHVVEGLVVPMATAIVMHLGKDIAATTVMDAFEKLRTGGVASRLVHKPMVSEVLDLNFCCSCKVVMGLLQWDLMQTLSWQAPGTNPCWLLLCCSLL